MKEGGNMTTQNQNQNDRTMMKLNFYAFLLAALFLFGTTHAQAQETKFGLKGGAALYTVTASISAFGESEEEKSDTHTGFGAGLFAEIPVSDIVSLQLEGLYMQKGASDELDEADIDDGDLTLSYIDVPIFLRFNLPLDEKIRPFVYGGGFAGYLLDAEAESGGESVDEIEIADLLTDINYGVVLGGGVSFGKLTLDVRYDIGLANLFDSESPLIDDLLQDANGFITPEELQTILDGIELTTGGLFFSLGISF